MLEKIISATSGKVGVKTNPKEANVQTVPQKRTNSSNVNHKHLDNQGEPPPYDAIDGDEILDLPPSGGLPRRDHRGFTITQKVGEFPNHVSLKIRYDHPKLGLSDVAFQRQHQLHHRPPRSISQNSAAIRANETASNRGVLSLGLPQQLMPASILRRHNLEPQKSEVYPPIRHLPSSATSDVIHHTYETLNSRHYSNILTLKNQENRSRQLRGRPVEMHENLVMLPPAQIHSRAHDGRGSSLPRRAKKIPSANFNEILLYRPKSAQEKRVVPSPDPFYSTPVEDLDSTWCHDVTVKTTDSGQTSGCSSEESISGSQSPRSEVKQIIQPHLRTLKIEKSIILM